MKKYIKSDRIGHNFGAGGPKYAIYVFDGDDNKWKTWGGWYRSLDEFDSDAFLDKINHPNFPNPEYNYDRNYPDVKIIPNGEDIADYVEASTSIECSKVIDFAEHKVTKDDVSDADWEQLQRTVNFDYYDSLQQMAQDLVNVIEDDQVWSEVEWNILHAWYDEKGFTDDDWDYVEACGYERDQF